MANAMPRAMAIGSLRASPWIFDSTGFTHVILHFRCNHLPNAALAINANEYYGLAVILKYGRMGDLYGAEMDIHFDKTANITHQDALHSDDNVSVPFAPDEIQGLYQFSPVGLGLFSLDYRYLRVNDMMAQFNGVAIADHIGRSIYDVVPDVAVLTQSRIDEVAASASPLPRHVIERVNPVTGHLSVYGVHWYPVFDASGAVQAVGAIAEDITEARKHEQMLRHVARELQHRVRNTLANVVALVDQATRSTHSASSALSVLKSRIGALAKTHGRLTEENWDTTSLTALIRQELTDIYGDKAVAFSGPDVRMTAQTALAFSMALHEMAANAMHYGALSLASGHIDLNWHIVTENEGTQSQQWLVFDWKETGGPTVNPDRTPGFGTRLIDASIKTSLHGKMERYWDSDGLRYHFRLPLKLLTGR